MKWVTYRVNYQENVGWLSDACGEPYVIPLRAAREWLVDHGIASPPEVNTLLQLIESDEENWNKWEEIQAILDQEQEWIKQVGLPHERGLLHSPLPNPPSLRDFYAFEEHVKKARERRGLGMVPEWYEFPVFYFSNHRAVVGPDAAIKYPKRCHALDFELEMACVIGKEGKDIPVSEAEEYIFGYTIMNDWSARDIQAKEVKVGLGPAKGKDFATSLGPYLVTKKELAPYRTANGRYDLEMSAYVNGKRISYGNFKDIYYSFAEIIARASENVTLFPGDVIGSGTVGSGCILELGPEVHRWLMPGDEVTLTITGLGSLTNKIIDE